MKEKQLKRSKGVVLPVVPEQYGPTGKQNRRNTKIATWEARLYNEIKEAFEDKSYKDKYWTINELCSLAHDDEYVTENKKRQTYYIIARLRPVLYEELGIEFYSVPVKGYTILYKKEDFIRVAQARIGVASTAFRTVKRVAKSGKIEDILLSMIKPKQIEDAKAILSLM